MNVKTAEVFVVCYGQEKLEKACIVSVKKHTDLRKHSLHVIDNYAQDSDLGSLWNKVVSGTKKEFVCFLNSDTIVEDGWLDKLIETAVSSYADAVGPMTNHCGVNFQVGRTTKVHSEERVSQISGFCFLLRRNSWKQAGGFREDFPFYGADSNLMNRIEHKVIRRDVFIRHVGHGSWEDDRNFEVEKAHAKEAYIRNRSFDWSKKVLIIGQPGHPVPVWTGIDWGLNELRREGLNCRYVHRDDLHTFV